MSIGKLYEINNLQEDVNLPDDKIDSQSKLEQKENEKFNKREDSKSSKDDLTNHLDTGNSNFDDKPNNKEINYKENSNKNDELYADRLDSGNSNFENKIRNKEPNDNEKLKSVNDINYENNLDKGKESDDKEINKYTNDSIDDTTDKWNDTHRDPTISNDQLKQVKEMEKDGSMDVKPSELYENDLNAFNNGSKYSDSYVLDYNYNPKHNYEDVCSQIMSYQDGMNNLTINDYLNNYENYTENGGSKGRANGNFEDAKNAQSNYHTAIKEEYGQDADKHLDALHNPDLDMGGFETGVNALGDRGVNRSIGRQMAHQSGDFHQHVLDISKDMTQEEKDSTHLNVFIRVNK